MMGGFYAYRCHSTARLFDRVLDIGSGDNPHPRADVSIDGSLSNEHRWSALHREKFLVLSDVELLPFRDKAFDVALCFHVLEHVRDPVKAAREIQRVARRGICEVPTLYGDLLFQPYSGHRWVFARDGNGLMYAPHPVELARFPTLETTLFLLKTNSMFRAAFLADLCAFRVRLHWRESIPIRKVTLEEIVLAASTAIKGGRHTGAFMQTARRLGGYALDLSSAAIRRAFQGVFK